MVIVEVRYELKEGCRKAFYDRLVSEGIGDASRNDEGDDPAGTLGRCGKSQKTQSGGAYEEDGGFPQ